MIAQLGVLKCGGAYVPLDPEYPLRRLGSLADDAGISVLLTVEGPPRASSARCARDRVAASRGGDFASGSREPGESLGAGLLAYVIYTSGSTGTPKGVEVTHRGVLRLLFGGGLCQARRATR